MPAYVLDQTKITKTCLFFPAEILIGVSKSLVTIIWPVLGTGRSLIFAPPSEIRRLASFPDFVSPDLTIN